MLTVVMLTTLLSTTLPEGPSPEPLLPFHFPDRLHAFVWRNWRLVPIERMAEVIEAPVDALLDLGKSMGLPDPPILTPDQQKRTYITIIRANWHLLNYEQLVKLLGWDESRLAYTLREDDFLFIKLGSLKPKCPPLQWEFPNETARNRASEIKAVVQSHFGITVGVSSDPPLSFVERLSTPINQEVEPLQHSIFDPRFCYSYFALYGDTLVDQDPFPEPYLQRLASVGVNGVWLHGVLFKLAPFPWQPELSLHWEERQERLRLLTERLASYGMGLYLYLNEPRTMPNSFFEGRPNIKGITSKDQSTLCTSVPEVREYIATAVAQICQAAPQLAGIFTITASENLTHCWSHFEGHRCPRCAERGPAKVVAELNETILEGIKRSGSRTRLLVWDWGWQEEWVPEIIQLLPNEVVLMSVSEWDIPILRGGIQSKITEYAISVIGPGPRAQHHWELARARGLSAVAKIQANNTWELGAIPYIPAVTNVARHIERLRDQGVSGLMLSWTLGGYPSPNLEVIYELGKRREDGTLPTADEALATVAKRRFGSTAPVMLQAWQTISDSFAEFPHHIGVVYRAPLQTGPSNLLWPTPTGYHATMSAFPYDDLDGWRAVYPPNVFIEQLQKTAAGFEEGAKQMRGVADIVQSDNLRANVLEEAALAEVAGIHFQSVANQAEFILLRNSLVAMNDPEQRAFTVQKMKTLISQEMELAKRLYAFQIKDSRIGFEATNHYFYTPMDLVEKVVNCAYLLEYAF